MARASMSEVAHTVLDASIAFFVPFVLGSIVLSASAYFALNPAWFMYELKGGCRGSYLVGNERSMDLHLQTTHFECVDSA